MPLINFIDLPAGEQDETPINAARTNKAFSFFIYEGLNCKHLTTINLVLFILLRIMGLGRCSLPNGYVGGGAGIHTGYVPSFKPPLVLALDQVIS